MLKGLEISEIKLEDVVYNKDKRIDTQFWTEKIYYNSHLKYERIGNCLENAQYGVSISMNEDGSGYPIYRMNEIHNMLCDIDVSKGANLEQHELKTFKLKNRDVLFNRTNSFEWVGRTGIYYKNERDNRDFVFASYLVRFIPDQKKILPEYLAAFLNTKYGIKDVKRRARQSINQTNVNPEEVKEIKIPLLAFGIQNKIASNFEKAYDNLILSQQKYAEAENLLLETVGFHSFQPSTEAVNVKSFKESFLATGRLDAEYYQPKYEKLIQLIKGYKDSFTLLANEGDFINGSFIPENFYVENSKRAYIRIKELSLNKPIEKKQMIFISHDFNRTNETQVKENDFVIATIGNTIGKVNLIPKELENSFPSNNTSVFRLKNRNYNFYYFEILLRSKLVQLQVEKEYTQTAQPKISNNSLQNIVIPKIDNIVQTKIEKLSKESYTLKAESEHLLEVSKRAIEIAIEESEEVAFDFINENSK